MSRDSDRHELPIALTTFANVDANSESGRVARLNKTTQQAQKRSSRRNRELFYYQQLSRDEWASSRWLLSSRNRMAKVHRSSVRMELALVLRNSDRMVQVQVRHSLVRTLQELRKMEQYRMSHCSCIRRVAFQEGHRSFS